MLTDGFLLMGDWCWVMSGEFWVIAGGCWMMDAGRWGLSGGFLLLGVEWTILDAERWIDFKI